jgi:hypothetical protein
VLSELPGVGASQITHTIVAGRRAASVTLTAPDSFVGCTTGDPRFRLWGLPETYGLAEGARSRISILDVGADRLVVVATDRGPGSAAEADLDELVSSIDLTVDPVPRPEDSRTPEPPELLPTLPATGAIVPGPYAFEVPIYARDAGGALARLPGPHDAALGVLPGWFATERGIASAPDLVPSASLAVWTVAAVHLDPCRWRTGELGTPDRSMVLDIDHLSQALSAWWPPNPDPVLTTGGYAPPPGAPRVARPIPIAWAGHHGWEIVLEVPSDLALRSCDDGTYRIWDDPLGRPRTAQPGERLRLTIADLDPGIVVLDAAYLPTAGASRVNALMTTAESTWIGLAPSP